MAEPVANSSNIAPWHFRAKLFCLILQANRCLADHQHLPLHRGLSLLILRIGLQAHSTNESVNRIDAVENIFEMSLRIVKRHESPLVEPAREPAHATHRQAPGPPSLQADRSIGFQAGPWSKGGSVSSGQNRPPSRYPNRRAPHREPRNQRGVDAQSQRPSALAHAVAEP